MSRLTRYGIINRTIQLGFSNIFSKMLGFVRELLLARYLGVGMMSDAFIAAYRLPNSLRKIFGEGALSAALVPRLVQVMRRDGVDETSRVVTLTLIIMQSIVALCVVFFVTYAEWVISFLAPGWAHVDYDRYIIAVKLLRILFPFIIFVSANAIWAAALNARNHFSAPLLRKLA